MSVLKVTLRNAEIHTTNSEKVLGWTIDCSKCFRPVLCPLKLMIHCTRNWTFVRLSDMYTVLKNLTKLFSPSLESTIIVQFFLRDSLVRALYNCSYRGSSSWACALNLLTTGFRSSFRTKTLQYFKKQLTSSP